MRTINLQPLIDRLAGPNGTTTTFSAVAQRGKAAAFRTDGPVSIAPGEITAQHDGTAWAAPPQLPPLPAGMHWRITVMIGGHHLGRHVTLPAGTGPVDFADLIDVDPATGIPSNEALAQWEAVLAQTTADARATARDRLDTLGFRTDARAARDEARADGTAADRSATRAEDAAFRAEAAAVGSGAGVEHRFDVPAATWTVPRPSGLTRPPTVTLFTLDGRLLLAGAELTATHVVITWPRPTAGFLVLT